LADAQFSPDMTRAPARSSNALALAVFTLFAALAALIVLIALIGNPMDGEPRATLTLASRPSPQQFAAQLQAPQPRFVNGNLVADPALIESTPSGPLPIIAADGRKPMTAYARGFDANDTRPRIAIVVGGLGLSAGATRLALVHLPPAVTVSFAPYASGLQPWVEAARGQGREVLIEVPMEPFDYPSSNPGPNTLLIAGKNENTKRLAWALSRATGYVGITNLLGGRFLGDVDAMTPVLGETAKRGLLFFENGAHSATAAAANRAGAPLVAAALVLDAVQARENVQAKLAELEFNARQNGTAVGSGIVYPLTIQEVVEWAKGLEQKGLVLVPVTAALAPTETSPAPASAQ
jgi:polysaccharide deacetylase 2 family uncharacterized protein YibQ